MKLKKTLFSFFFLSFALFLIWRFVRPLNIFVVDEKFERPMHVERPEGLTSLSARECGGCHEDIYREWSGSMHAKAWIDPYFQVDYRYDGSQQICQNCHIPIENQQTHLVLGFRDREKFDPILKPNPDYDPELQSEGVTCAVCHIRNGKIVGPFETDNAPHPVAVDPGMTRGIKYCERCHVVTGRRWDTFYRIPPCGTVAEIKAGGRKPDCVGCHMPRITRPVVRGMKERRGGRHLFQGGHHPETVSSALEVRYRTSVRGEDTVDVEVVLTNIGAAHYLPTGTPDRYLSLEFRLYGKGGNLVQEETFRMKRYILWRPFIVDLKDTRLPFRVPKRFGFSFREEDRYMPYRLDIRITYHLLDEKRRREIGYEAKDPIAYTIYERRISLEGLMRSADEK